MARVIQSVRGLCQSLWIHAPSACSFRFDAPDLATAQLPSAQQMGPRLPGICIALYAGMDVCDAWPVSIEFATAYTQFTAVMKAMASALAALPTRLVSPIGPSEATWPLCRICDQGTVHHLSAMWP